MDLATHYLEVTLAILKNQKTLAERAMLQLEPTDFFKQPSDESNNIAIIVKHLAGNMRSRWKDFLITDGEKQDRNRDSEFINPPQDKRLLLELWEEGWNYVFDAIKSLDSNDLTKEVMIRDEPHTVIEAIQRQLDHYGQHIGQIIYLARHFKGKDFASLSIPKGQSEAFIPKSLKAKWATSSKSS